VLGTPYTRAHRLAHADEGLVAGIMVRAVTEFMFPITVDPPFS
jgi:hypothetical protein